MSKPTHASSILGILVLVLMGVLVVFAVQNLAGGSASAKNWAAKRDDDKGRAVVKALEGT